MKIRPLTTLILLLFSIAAYAGDLKIENAWSRATAPGQEVGSIGMVITSAKAARLVAVSSPAAKSAEIHTMSMEGGVMKMRQLEYLDLPANQPVTLGPGGDHLMLFGLKKPLQAGAHYNATLTVEYADKKTEKVEVKVEVKTMGAKH